VSDDADDGPRYLVRFHTRSSNAVAAVLYGGGATGAALLFLPRPWNVVAAVACLLSAGLWCALWHSVDDLWIERDTLHERTRRGSRAVALDADASVRFCSGFRTDSRVAIESGCGRIEVPINETTRELRAEVGRLLMVAHPGRVFGDARATRALAMRLH